MFLYRYNKFKFSWNPIQNFEILNVKILPYLLYYLFYTKCNSVWQEDVIFDKMSSKKALEETKLSSVVLNLHSKFKLKMKLNTFAVQR